MNFLLLRKEWFVRCLIYEPNPSSLPRGIHANPVAYFRPPRLASHQTPSQNAITRRTSSGICLAYNQTLAGLPTMAEITTALGTATTLFGVAITLCVLVTGFFVGRSWLRRVK